jgi:hypothetical protein
MTELEKERSVLAKIEEVIASGKPWLPLTPEDTPEILREKVLRNIARLEHP